MNLIEKAIIIMLEAHQGQKRKFDGQDFVIHPIEVALKAASAGFNENAIAAALVHDVLEDTNYSRESLRQQLGEEVFYIVESLTKDKSLPYLDQKKKMVEMIASGSENVKIVALADKIAGLQSVIGEVKRKGGASWQGFEHSKEQKIWFHGYLLESLKGWDHPFMKEYEKLVKEIKTMQQ